MSEEAAAPPEGPSAGALLRQAREAAGLHVATLAANLKVPVRKVEALEEDQYEQLGDAVFVRGLASSICRTLKIDPQPVLQRLPQTASPRLVQEGEGINAPFRAPGDGPAPGLLDQVSRPVVLIVLALLLGALVLVFLPIAQRGAQAPEPSGKPEPALPQPQPQPGPEAGGSAVPAAQETVAAAAGPASAAATPAPAPASPSGLAAPASPRPAANAAANAAQPPASAAAVPASGIVVFRTHGPSWIEVTDATRATVLRKLMAAGETAGATGALPLSVTIGSVQVTDVEVRGKPYNLAPVSRDNVARFEVK